MLIHDRVLWSRLESGGRPVKVNALTLHRVSWTNQGFIVFEISSDNPASGRLLYFRSEFSLDTEPKPLGGVASLLINDVQLEINEDGRLLYVWGYCPEQSWRTAVLKPPEATGAQLRWKGRSIPRGASLRLNESGPWDILFDPIGHNLRIGSTIVGGQFVAFAPGATAELSHGSLVCLWLKLSARV